MNTDKETRRRLEALGRYVLETLDAERNWSAATLDDVADFAERLGLADADDAGLFRRLDTGPNPIERAVIQARNRHGGRP